MWNGVDVLLLKKTNIMESNHCIGGVAAIKGN